MVLGDMQSHTAQAQSFIILKRGNLFPGSMEGICLSGATDSRRENVILKQVPLSRHRVRPPSQCEGYDGISLKKHGAGVRWQLQSGC